MASLYSFVHPVGTHVWCLVIAITTQSWPSCECQTVTLSAAHTGQNSPFSVYFADGQDTSVIGSQYLPHCAVSSGSGPYVRLEKTDGSLRISEQGPLTGAGVFLPWDTTAHPTLNTSYSGTYICRTTTTFSAAVYQINIVQRLNVTLNPSTLMTDGTGQMVTVLASVRGTSNFSTTWTSSVALTTREEGVSSFSFRSNDSSVSPSVPFNVSVTARYQPAIPCSGTTTGPGYSLSQTVIDNCNAAATPSQATATITVQATHCDNLDSLGLNVNATVSTPNYRGAKVTLVCTGNHNLTNDIREVECLATGKWTALPVCEVTHCPAQNTSTIERVDRHPVNPTFDVSVSCIDGYDDPTLPLNIRCLTGGVWSTPQPVCSAVDECKTGKNNCMEYCTDTTPGYICVCYNGTLGCLAPAYDPAVSPTTPPAQTESTNTLVVAIGAAAGGVAVGMLLMLLIVILLKHRKTHQTERKPAPRDTSVPATQNVAYEDADVEMTETQMTSSEAYGVMDVPPQPNYEYVQP